MSRTVRIAAALLILAALTSGSLGALPLRPPVLLAEHGRSFLAAVAEWITSILEPDRPVVTAPQRPQPKDGAGADPGGGAGSGGG